MVRIIVRVRVMSTVTDFPLGIITCVVRTFFILMSLDFPMPDAC